jgi:CBS-domain-containing membrane protein
VREARSILFAGAGGFALILVLTLLGAHLEQPLILGSFGATCVLVFGFPELPFSQPRNVLFGHGMSSLIGLGCLEIMGVEPWAMATAVALAIMAMMATKTVHPPAGSNPVIIFLTHPKWSFLLLPTIAGAALIIAFALLYNNATRDQKYPNSW